MGLQRLESIEKCVRVIVENLLHPSRIGGGCITSSARISCPRVTLTQEFDRDGLVSESRGSNFHLMLARTCQCFGQL